MHTTTKNRTIKQRGLIMPLVLVVSLGTLLIMTPLIARLVTSLDISHTSFRTRLAQEAARAGLTYATACYNQGGGTQTWGPAAGNPNLDPSTDCNGSPIAGKSKYLFNNGGIRSYFDIGDITYNDEIGIEVTAQGYTEGLTVGGTVAHTYTNQLKRVSWGDGSSSTSGGNTAYQVGLGRFHGCALVKGNVYCWGSNTRGQLGTGQNNPSSSTDPVPVAKEPGVMAGETISEISVGDYTTCAVSESGKLFCWGIPVEGGAYNYKPVQMTGALAGKNVTAVGLSDNFACTIADGKIYCWGSDSYGDMGNGVGLQLGSYSSGTSSSTPTLVNSVYLPASYQAVKLANTGGIATQMCAILTTGQMYCWGGNRNGELGIGIGTVQQGSYWRQQYGSVSAPYPVYNSGYLGGNGVSVVATNGSTQNANNVSCAVSNGYPYCTYVNGLASSPWNEPANNKFELIAGTYTPPMIDIAVGGQGEQTCAVASDGLYCWNAGLRSTSPWYNATRNTPQKISTIGGYPTTSLVGVAAYWNSMCALFQDGHVFCWSNFNAGSGTLTNLTEIEQVYKLVHNYYF